MGRKGDRNKKGNQLPNSNKRDNVERLKQEALAKKVVEQQENSPMESVMKNMSEDEKKLFMSQEEVLKREQDVEIKEKALDSRETELIQKQESLDLEKEKNLKDKEEIKSLQEKNSAESIRLKKKEVELFNRERVLIEREANAEAGFVEQNKKALEELKISKEKLNKEITSLEKRKIEAEMSVEHEMSSIRNLKQESIDQELETYSLQRKKLVDLEVADMKKNAQLTIDSEKADLKKQREALEQERKELSEQKIKQDRLQRRLESDENDLAIRESLLEEDLQDNERKIQIEVEKRVKKTAYDLEQTKQDLMRMKSILDNTQNELAEYKDRERAADGQSQEELIKERDSYKEEIDRLKKELATRPNVHQFADYQAKAESYDQMSKELHDARAEIAQLKLEEGKWMDMNMQLGRARSECMAYQKMIETKQAILDKYSEEVNRLKSLYEQPKELAKREETIKMPVLLRRPFTDITSSQSESEWLNTISEKCEMSGIKFGKRLLYAFHTSLKTAGWSPLTVLAGVSGTGKSLLPEYYSRYGGIYFMSMAVQPDWDSPQSLFGYFNSVDNRFNATPLLQAMVQFRDDQKNLETNLSDSMFIVLLDEMNLAHVELYFSDMLSKLERCRNTEDQICVDIDLGAGVKKYQLPLSDNILWVGTMNEDETTKSLSDKVLDRGNLISFPRPRTFESRHSTKGVEAAHMLRKEKWNEWVDSNVIENLLFVENIIKYKKGLEEINEALAFAGRALGHRVWQTVENYMANHPLVVNACSKDKASSADVDKYMRYAFEEALVYKVMPKLRGIETDGEMRARTIDRISTVLFDSISGLAPGLESDFKKAIENPYDTFIWNSADYLEEEGLFE